MTVDHCVDFDRPNPNVALQKMTEWVVSKQKCVLLHMQELLTMKRNSMVPANLSTFGWDVLQSLPWNLSKKQ